MHTSSSNNSKSISVSELNRQARSLLENSFLSIRVSGELSNFARPASGHWYFTLKDQNAQVRCAMFRGRNQAVTFRPKEGDQVVVTAKVSLYEGRGDFQLICDRMEEDGLGKLQIAFDALKRKLDQEGLFDASRKRPIPSRPSSLGIITSETGAAIHDILTVLKRRFPGLSIYLYPTPVQGDEAVPGICRALELANRDKRVDVLILGRGGGSLEDLWAFNEEAVARAVVASSIPVVSAVGHEVDICITDLVADLRAPTPSAAAELLSPDQQEIRAQLNQSERALIQRLKWQLQRKADQLRATTNRLRHPGERIRERIQRLDDLEIRLTRATNRLMIQRAQRLEHYQQRLLQQRPDKRVIQMRQRLTLIAEQIERTAKQLIERKRIKLGQQAGRLQDISPLSTLERGYALVTDKDGQVVRNAESVKTGNSVNVRVQQGSFNAIVE